jgi:hypothetical protein
MTKKGEWFAIEAFSVLSFLRDKEVGCFEEPGFKEPETFYDMPADEQDVYRMEAKFYLEKQPEDNWPTDIEETLKSLKHR